MTVPQGLTIRHLPITDPLAEPLLAELLLEYTTRYGEGARVEMSKVAAEEFEAPDGAFVLLVEDGEAVAGGAFRRRDPETAELKRIWTHSAHRRRGLARLVLAELESTARERGYRRVYLTTGSRQPEAVGLYLSTGYRALSDLGAVMTRLTELEFDKELLP
jgi:GNAT superfamily N-acetyltransferase